MKNLRIRAYMQTPIIADNYLPLDAVLYYHHCRLQLGEQVVTKANEVVDSVQLLYKLPFKVRDEFTKSWYYSCSFAVWADNMVEDSTFKVKQGDWVRFTNHLDSKVKKIENKRGKFKSYLIKMYYKSVTHIDWYCVGDVGEILKLLKFCTAIGKNTGDGWGQVLRWEVTEEDEDYSIRGKNNQLMRAIPSDVGVPYGVRPSYWLPKHIFRCELP